MEPCGPARFIPKPTLPDLWKEAALMGTPNLVLDLARIRSDAHNGTLSVDYLIDIIEQQQHRIKRLEADKRQLAERLAKYEPEAAPRPDTNEPQNRNASYSVEAEEKRRQQRSGRRRRREKSPGRTPTEQKFAAAQKYEDVYPDGVEPATCHLVRERAVWRFIANKAVRVGYRIYAGPDGKEPPIPGVTPRCEYGIEILVVLAFLVYVVGMSIDKACVIMCFFCELPLAKSQADALLRQLAQHWEVEYETLCDMLVHAAVVYMDETGWKVGNEKCSMWAFASQLHRVFLFGCHKDDATLDAMLPPDKFDGIGVSDNAKVYYQRFTRGQKCWAHLLRKAIKLALEYPDNTKYQGFLDALLQIYYDAKRVAADKRLGEEGRKQKVVDLVDRLARLLLPHMEATDGNATVAEQEFTALANEIGTLLMAEELFTFVLHPEVDPTNNLTEREERPSTQDRKAGRTNKTTKGARRRSVIMSVLHSLRVNMEDFKLVSVVKEIEKWMKEGISLFTKQWEEMQERLRAKAAAEAATANTV
jgi:hypothetical protein